MGRFDGLRLRIANVESLSRLSESDVEAIKSEYSGLPVDYLEFLQEIGFGDLGEIQLYSGPVDADSIYPSMGEHLSSILLIGDDMQGYCFGFDCHQNNRLVEIDPKGTIEREIGLGFGGLLRRYFS